MLPPTVTHLFSIFLPIDYLFTLAYLIYVLSDTNILKKFLLFHKIVAPLFLCIIQYKCAICLSSNHCNVWNEHLNKLLGKCYQRHSQVFLPGNSHIWTQVYVQTAILVSPTQKWLSLEHQMKVISVQHKKNYNFVKENDIAHSREFDVFTTQLLLFCFASSSMCLSSNIWPGGDKYLGTCLQKGLLITFETYS